MNAVSIDAALRDPNLLGAALGDPETFAAWLAVLRAAFGDKLNREDRRAFDAVAGGRAPPDQKVRELWAIVGRRGGKSRMAAAVAAFIACLVDHSGRLAPGESGFVLVLSPTRNQARLVYDYARSFIEQSPLLRSQVEEVTAEEIKLKGGVVLTVATASFRTVRGRTILAAVFDESAFWRDDTGANPDIEIYRAIVPSLIASGGLLVGISSPYRKVGLLYSKYQTAFGKDDPSVLVIQAPSRIMNPTLHENLIQQARADDPEAAASEWDAQFRSDLSALLDDASIEAAINTDRPLELTPQPGVRYFVFVDPSGGRHDAFCMAVAHVEGEQVICDALRAVDAPFDTRNAVSEFAMLAREYRCSRVVGDAYSGAWVRDAFRDCGITYEVADRPKSQLYLEGLPLFTRRTVSIPDDAKLTRELRLLERRTHRSGKDTVDHGSGGADDRANALFGAIYLANAASRSASVIVASIGVDGRVSSSHREQERPFLYRDNTGALRLRAPKQTEPQTCGIAAKGMY